MLRPEYSGQFKRDVERVKKRGKDLEKFKTLAQLLIAQKPLPAKYRDHPLKGEWKHWRDAHIEPDWVLIYRLGEDAVRFERTGTHADLFE